MTSRSDFCLKVQPFSPLRTPHVEQQLSVTKKHKKKKKQHTNGNSILDVTSDSSKEHQKKDNHHAGDSSLDITSDIISKSPKKHKKKKKHHGSGDNSSLDMSMDSQVSSSKKHKKKKKLQVSGDNDRLDMSVDKQEKSSKKHKKKKDHASSVDDSNMNVTRDILEIADLIHSRLENEDKDDTSSITSRDIFLTQNIFESPSKRLTDSQISNDVHTNLLMKNYGRSIEEESQNISETIIPDTSSFISPEEQSNKSKKKKKKKSKQSLPTHVEQNESLHDCNNNAASFDTEKIIENESADPESLQVTKDIQACSDNISHPHKKDETSGNLSDKQQSPRKRTKHKHKKRLSIDDRPDTVKLSNIVNGVSDEEGRDLNKDAAQRQTDKHSSKTVESLSFSDDLNESGDEFVQSCQETFENKDKSSTRKQRLSLSKTRKQSSESEAFAHDSRKQTTLNSRVTDDADGVNASRYKPPENFILEEFDSKVENIVCNTETRVAEFFLIRSPAEFEINQLIGREITLDGKVTVAYDDDSNNKKQYEVHSYPEAVLEKGKYVPLLWDEAQKTMKPGSSISRQIHITKSIDIPEVPIMPVLKSVPLQHSKQKSEPKAQKKKTKDLSSRIELLHATTESSKSQPTSEKSDIESKSPKKKKKKKKNIEISEQDPDPGDTKLDQTSIKTPRKRKLSECSDEDVKKSKKKKKKKLLDESVSKDSHDLSSPNQTLDSSEKEITFSSKSHKHKKKKKKKDKNSET